MWHCINKTLKHIDYHKKSIQIKHKRYDGLVKIGISNVYQLINFLRSQTSTIEFPYLSKPSRTAFS